MTLRWSNVQYYFEMIPLSQNIEYRVQYIMLALEGFSYNHPPHHLHDITQLLNYVLWGKHNYVLILEFHVCGEHSNCIH
jgi:hypothetical protein